MPDRVVFRALAEADIETIGDRIARDSQRNAVAWVSDMQQRCQLLADFPERWPVHGGAIRRMVVGNYLVFFRVADPDIPSLRRVIVIRVLHGARDIREISDSDV
jgi:toxin ParE1/3/4